ncbi:MAG: ParA family protein [Candidatus Gastranaerophilales bacterium]|nr:ParA family protein [Candidatus Gastranaerophilales bacterium]
MTITIAVTGKSGSGKTTITKALYKIMREYYPEKSVLLFDNDLTGELGHSFGKDIRNTIYGIRSGKHEYKTGIPSNMTKQEYVEWALEDILEPLDDNTDIIVSWLIGSKDCRCPITKQINDALVKLINRYDIVIFDCEFDLKYLHQLVDVELDVTLIIAKPTEEAVHLAKRIEEFSAKYAAGAQMGVVLNKVKGTEKEPLFELLQKYNLETLGVIHDDRALKENPMEKDSETVTNEVKEFFYRLNLPRA